MDIGMVAPGQQDWNRNQNMMKQVMEQVAEKNKAQQQFMDNQSVKATEANREEQAIMEARQPQQLLNVLA